MLRFCEIVTGRREGSNDPTAHPPDGGAGVTRRQFQFFDAEEVDRFFDTPSAEFSACGRYRYLLRWPTGLPNERRALLIGANPSTATEKQLDATLIRWLRYCTDWGYGWSWTVITPRLPTTLQREIDRVYPLLDAWLAELPSDIDPEALALCLLKSGVQYMTEATNADVAREAAIMFVEGER